jgi:hypothetical protein
MRNYCTEAIIKTLTPRSVNMQTQKAKTKYVMVNPKDKRAGYYLIVTSDTGSKFAFKVDRKGK